MAAATAHVNPEPKGSVIIARMRKSLEAGYAPGASEEAKRTFQSQTPLGRYVECEEVGRLALFLAGDESSMITGATYVLDGGLCA